MEKNEVPVLVTHTGETAGKRWAIQEDVVTIGRAPDCQIMLSERRVSRYHARILRDGSRFLIEDLGSKNGTTLNGKPIHANTVLQDGDIIEIALSVKMVFIGSDATVPLSPDDRVSMGRLQIDVEKRQVWYSDKVLTPSLSLAQFRLLRLLYQANGSVCTRDEIIDAVWPDTHGIGVSEQAIDALVRRLRDRLSEIDDHEYVVTVRGHGFCLDNPTR